MEFAALLVTQCRGNHDPREANACMQIKYSENELIKPVET
jgi:hypothetical protein